MPRVSKRMKKGLLLNNGNISINYSVNMSWKNKQNRSATDIKNKIKEKILGSRSCCSVKENSKVKNQQGKRKFTDNLIIARFSF